MASRHCSLYVSLSSNRHISTIYICRSKTKDCVCEYIYVGWGLFHSLEMRWVILDVGWGTK